MAYHLPVFGQNINNNNSIIHANLQNRQGPIIIMTAMAPINSIDPTYLTMLCDAFVHLDSILSDGEVGALLVSSGIQDPSPNASRHRRLSLAFTAQQDIDKNAGSIAVFFRRTGFHIKKRYGDDAYKKYREEINQVLTFAGYELDDQSEMKQTNPLATIYASHEAESRAKRLKEAVLSRGMHPDIQMVCRSEYLTENNYFRVVQEALKLLMEKNKAKSQLHIEGPAVAEHAFGFNWGEYPVLTVNDFRSEVDQTEQFGFMCILKALFLMVQDENTRTYRFPWHMNLDDALDFLGVISYCHRKVDGSKKAR